MPLLSVNHVHQRYGKKVIVDDISFSVDRGEIIALLGPNGAGKTTLLCSVIGLLNVRITEKGAGGIFWDGNPVHQLPIDERVGKGLLYLPQQTSLFLDLTALENLKLVYQNHPYWAMEIRKNQSKAQMLFNSKMHKWLEQAGLTNTLKQKCFYLSGGQRRKLEVVRCLLMNPRVIMLDEPFAGVDPKSIYELKTIFLELAKAGMGIVISDHHVDQLLSIATRVYVVVDGKVVVSGGIEEIMENKYTREMYLGKQFHDEMVKRFVK